MYIPYTLLIAIETNRTSQSWRACSASWTKKVVIHNSLVMENFLQFLWPTNKKKRFLLMTESETHLACCYCNRLNMFLFFFPFRHKNIIYSKRNNIALLWYLGNSVCCCFYYLYIFWFFSGFCMWSVFLFRPRECRQGLSRSIPPPILRTQRTFQISYARSRTQHRKQHQQQQKKTTQ